MRFQSSDVKAVTFEVSSGPEPVGQLTGSCEHPETGSTGAFKQLVTGPQGRASPRPSRLLDRFPGCPNPSQSPHVPAKSRSVSSLPRR